MKSVRIRNFSSPFFPAFRLNMERYEVFLCIQSKWGKMLTRKSPKTDSFHAVLKLLKIKFWKKQYKRQKDFSTLSLYLSKNVSSGMTFSFWTQGVEELMKFSKKDLKYFDNSITFTLESSRENVSFLDLKMNFWRSHFITDLQLHIKFLENLNSFDKNIKLFIKSVKKCHIFDLTKSLWIWHFASKISIFTLFHLTQIIPRNH